MSLADLGPIRLLPEDAAYEAALRESLVKELYGRSAVSLLALVPLLFILRALFDFPWSLAPGLKWAFGFLVLVLAARLALLAWIRLNPERLSPRAMSWCFLAGVTAIALGFAAVNFTAWTHLDVAQVGLLVIIHAGINAAALSSLAPSAWAYLAYMGLDVASLLFLSAAKGGMGNQNNLLVLMLAIYLVALTVLSLQAHRSLVQQALSALKLKDMSLQDALTGLRNRRFLLEFMGPESELVLRSWQPGSPVQQSLDILMLDLDHFKQVNDTYGHPAGDAVLKQLATLLAGALRRQDLLIRWGGEEFVIVARGADRGYALTLAERIREKVGAHTFLLPDGTELKLTCSLGYSLYPFSPGHARRLSWEQVLSLADACLYRAKTLGRNRAIGAFPGERPWDEGAAGQLEMVKQDLAASAREGLVKLMGELR